MNDKNNKPANKSIKEFVDEHLREILKYVKPSDAFEYFSNPANNHPFHIIVKSRNGELLGEFKNAVLVSGCWSQYKSKVSS